MKDLVRLTTGKSYPTISELEKALLSCEDIPGAKAEAHLTHRFGDGVYTRTMVMPAGVAAIGRRQRFKTVNILTRGKVIMYESPGSKGVEVSAPYIYTSEAGDKKLGYFVEETEWTSVHLNPYNYTDLKVLEAFLYAEENEIIDIKPTKAVDRKDYELLLSELDMTEEQVRKQVENMSDAVSLPLGSYKFEIRESSIEGKGVFAIDDITEGEEIAPARIGDGRTVVGRFTNHSANPNAKMVLTKDGVTMVATTDIKGSGKVCDREEITTNYRDTIKTIKEGTLCHQ